jgi:hypothetical protein
VVGHRHRKAVIVVGEKPPAMSVSWEPPTSRNDSGYVVIFSEFDPELGDDDPTPSQVVCMGCLIEDADAQLGEGLDFARRYGQVDWDVELAEWFDPETGEAA